MSTPRHLLRRLVGHRPVRPTTPTGRCTNCGLPELDSPLSTFCSQECREEHPQRPAHDVGATRDTAAPVDPVRRTVRHLALR